MKKQFLSTLLASALAVSYVPVASAAMDLTHSFVSSTTDTGSGVTSVLSVPSSAIYGNTFGTPTSVISGSTSVAHPAGFGFYDDFLFTITSASANSITSTLNLGVLSGVNDLSVRLYAKSTNTFPVLLSPVSPPIDAWSTPYSAGPGQTFTVAILPATALAAGTYVLEVRGNVTGAAGGSYSGTLNVDAVPVPAAAWLFGSSLIGLVSLRRKLA
jgi:hypothetical protein